MKKLIINYLFPNGATCERAGDLWTLQEICIERLVSASMVAGIAIGIVLGVAATLIIN